MALTLGAAQFVGDPVEFESLLPPPLGDNYLSKKKKVIKYGLVSEIVSASWF
jgi:hypothetical protein